MTDTQSPRATLRSALALLLAPVAALAGVYIGGLQTERTTRLELAHQAQATVRSERKESYVHFVRTMEESVNTSLETRDALNIPDYPQRPDLADRLLRHSASLADLKSQVVLFGSQEQQELVIRVLDSSRRLAQMAGDPLVSSEDFEVVYREHRRAMSEFIVGARLELGTEN